MNQHFDPETEKRIAAEVERRAAEILERTADSEQTIVRLREELAITKAKLQTNIEEQKAANEELRVTNEELETAYEELRITHKQLEKWNAFAHAPVGLVIADPEGRYLQVNEAYCRLLGYQEQELLRLDFKQLTHPDDLKVNLAEYDRLLAGEIPAFFIEKRDLRKDGTPVWVRASATIQRDAEGRPSRIIGIVENIDERRRAEAALRESESRFRMVLENSLDAAYRRNLRIDRYDYVSPVIEQMTGYKAKDFIQLKLEGVLARIHLDDVDRVRREVERILAGEKTIGQADYRFKTKNGNYRWLSDRYQVLRDDAGRPLYRLGIIRDITEAKQKEEELLHLTEELSRSNRELEQFAYIASHDLQTPLRSITGFLDLLSHRYQRKLGADADEFISYAVEGAERMHQLINDILAFSRVGTTGNPFEDMDAREPLQKALGYLQAEIEESRAEVTFDILPMVRADRNQLVQLFQNLVGNAVKYRRPEEPPRIHVTAEGKERKWEFRVQDNGIGIDPQYVERIFQIFQRLHSNKEYVGTGIGLAICKKIVERHGGRVWAESEPGKGSTFFFTLPKT